MNIGIDNKGVLEFTRIRFEYFYNGVLTFDLAKCNLNCLFCFAKITRKNYKNLDNIKINLNDIEFKIGAENNENTIILKNKDLVNYINLSFGKEENNLINKEYENKKRIKVVFTVDNISELILKIKEIISLKPSFRSFRFSGGEISQYFDWFNEFLEKFFEDSNNNLNLIIETNGTFFNEENTRTDNESKFLELLKKITKNKKKKNRLYIRISLKNPYHAFYKVLTQNGSEKNLEQAIKFGIFCEKHGINYHYTFMANFLTLDDIYYFKVRLNKIKELKENPSFFMKNFMKLEFEKMFYYKGVFEEIIIATYLLEKDECQTDVFANLLKKVDKYTQDYKEQAESRRKKQFSEFTREEKDYLDLFRKRAFPTFKIETNIFQQQLKHLKNLMNSYLESLTKEKDQQNRSKINGKKDNVQIFDGYEGLQEFWMRAFQNRYFLQNNMEFPKKYITFKNVSLLDRIPLYPGIFYTRDFWKQNNPSFFSYALYAESEYLELATDTYLFSINANPHSHAHTDISRAIPIIIRIDKNNRNKQKIINKIRNNQVIFFEEISAYIQDFSNY
ncbi:MAG: hypothetical protein ACTSWN_02025, partial [Promethearchaeota archaeon]